MSPSRRSSGEGSVYKTADGRFRAHITVGWVDGKRQSKYFSGRTRTEVAAKLRAAHVALANGELVAGRSWTVREWLAYWLENPAAARVRPSTLAGYRHYVNRWLIPHLGRYRLEKLTAEHLEALYRHMREQGLAPATVLQAHRILARALKVAEQHGRVGRSVATLVDAPSVEREEVEPLSVEQVRSVLQVSSGDRNAARWSVALALGLRQGEALGLTWSDVDLDAGTLRVRQALQRIPGQGLTLGQPKSRAGRRTITLPASLLHALQKHQHAQMRERLGEGPEWKGWTSNGRDLDLVFAQRDGRPIGAAQDRAAWHDLLQRAGVRRVRLHDARHTAATLMLLQGTPARVVMDVLGHSAIAMTMNTYSHVVPQLQREAALLMDEALWGSSRPA